ncbi:MAG: CDP-diacylglycerol--glycerol-3-phosphate 3-phosphatidyltransferase [Oligoflexia bacterium]|nr:CDP-diacylglycerol--glycerol-3-phosphate 3-phosphatidyltransferase [Oligoflexia bacterium]
MKSQRLPFWKRQLPNFITGLRIAFIPPVVIALLYDTPEAGFWAAVFFILASVSDFFDGYFARIYNVESLLGKFLDPVADKLLVTAALVMLIPLGRVSAILVLLILSRDLLINGLRAVAASEKFVIGAGWTGKWKTGAQMCAIPCLMLKNPLLGVDLLLVGQILLWISLVLSLISGFQYLRDFFSRYSEMP